jgi:hypothetical protein
MAVSNWIILWTDNDGDAHLRLLKGSAADVERAKKLLHKAHDDGDGIRRLRVMVSDGNFGSLEAIAEEVKLEREGR